jgi:hypothetical protein
MNVDQETQPLQSCHPERSEGSRSPPIRAPRPEILRSAQDDIGVQNDIGTQNDMGTQDGRAEHSSLLNHPR